MARLVIFGTGEGARLAHVYFTHDSEHEVVAFTVDRAYQHYDTFRGLPLVPFEEIGRLYPPQHYQMFIPIGYSRMNQGRAAKYHEAKAQGYQLTSYLSSRATFLTDEPLGDNCFIMEGVTIQPHARIGNNVILWSGAHVAAGAIIEDHCFLASGSIVLSRAHVHPFCFIGANATVGSGLTLAPETLIGAGATLRQDTLHQGVYVPPRDLSKGNPPQRDEPPGTQQG